MLKTTLKIAALSAVSLTLIACGGSGGGGNNNSALNPPSSPTAAVADRVTSVRVVGPFNNGGIPIQTRNFSYNLTADETQDTFALVQSGNNLVMTVNGTAYTFTPENASSTGSYDWITDGAGRLFNSSSSGADIRTVLNGTHSTIQGDYVDYSTLPNLESHTGNLDYTTGYATIGIQTLPSVVASQTATATYQGAIELDLLSASTKIAGQEDETNSITGSTTEYITGGDLTMTANFTNNTIAGGAAFNVRSVATDQLIPNRVATVTFNSAPIVGNGFAGTFTMNAEYRNVQGITNNPTGNYAGNFFGPAADDIAGVMRFGAQGSAVGIGGFRADRDTQ